MTEKADEAEGSALSSATAVLMDAINWAYDKATNDIPGLGSAEGLADSHLKNCNGDREKAIDELINWQIGYAGATGFITNLGGIVTLPVAIPANIAGVLLIQLRLIAAIAHLYGHNIRDERVRTLAYLCLTGSSAATVLQEFGVNLATKLSAQVIAKIPGSILIQINKAVGFRLVTKAGTTGLINITKVLPLIGGIVGGAWDAVATRTIASIAREAFRTGPVDLEGEFSEVPPEE